MWPPLEPAAGGAARHLRRRTRGGDNNDWGDVATLGLAPGDIATKEGFGQGRTRAWGPHCRVGDLGRKGGPLAGLRTTGEEPSSYLTSTSEPRITRAPASMAAPASPSRLPRGSGIARGETRRID